MASQRISITATPNSGNAVTAATTTTNDAYAGIGTSSLPGSQTNVPYDIAFPYARVKSYILYSPVAMTIKTNSSGSPDNTIALPAGVAVVWNTSMLGTSLFTADVTKMYITNVAAAAGVVIEVIYDPTA